MRKNDIKQADGKDKPKKDSVNHNNSKTPEILIECKRLESKQKLVSVKVSNHPPTWKMMTKDQKKQFLNKVV